MAMVMSRTTAHPQDVISSIYFHSELSLFSTLVYLPKQTQHTVSRSAEFSSKATPQDLGVTCMLVTNLNSNNASVWILLEIAAL